MLLYSFSFKAINVAMIIHRENELSGHHFPYNSIIYESKVTFVLKQSSYLRVRIQKFLDEKEFKSKITYGAKVLVQNTCSLFSNPETTSESQKQLVRLRIFRSFRIWVQKFCVSFCYGIMKESLKDLERQFGQKCFSYILKIRIRNQMLKLLLIYQFVELNLLYKMHYFTFFLSFKKVPSFSFFSMILILRKAPF